LFGLEASQAALDSGFDVLRLTVDAAIVQACVGIDIPTEFGGDFHLVAEWRESVAHHLLIRKRTINLGGIEEVNAALDRFADEVNLSLRSGISRALP
jgi:hypothetical protein